MNALIKERVNAEELPVLSASSINMYLKDPAAWVLKHFYGVRTEENIYAARGKAVESGILAKTPEEVNAALREFRDVSFFHEDEELCESIAFDLSGWISEGKKALQVLCDAHGAFDVQKELTGEIDGLPFTGFLDYSFADIDVDLKTAKDVPSAVTRGPRVGMLPATKNDNVRQQAIYNHLTGKRTALLFCSPVESFFHELTAEEMKPLFSEVREAVAGIKDLLKMDMKDILAKHQPDWTKMRYSFYWDDASKALAEEVWEDYVL